MRRRWLAALAAAMALIALPALAADLLSPADFQDRVVAAIVRANPGARIERQGVEGFIARLPDRPEADVSLVRLYGVYTDEPERLQEIVDHLVSIVSTPQAAPTPEMLIVLVRPLSFDSGRASADPKQLTLHKVLVGDLGVFVGLNESGRLGIVPAADLRAQLKMDDAAIWARATANTRPHLGFQPQPIAPGGAALITTEEGLAASLLTDDSYWDSPELTAGGPVVVSVADRDGLLVVRLADAEQVANLRRSVESTPGDPNRLTDNLLVRRNGRWEILDR